MVRVGIVQSTNFIALLRELGISRNEVPFTLQSEIVPVALVTSGVAFTASPTPAYTVTDIFTIGLQVAPAVNTVLADSGPLPIGAHTIQVILYCDASARFEFQWRNAGNTGNLWVQELLTGPAGEPRIFKMDTRLFIENPDERFRVLNTVVGGVGERFQASILAKI